jgi:hypothetical protein
MAFYEIPVAAFVVQEQILVFIFFEDYRSA